MTARQPTLISASRPRTSQYETVAASDKAVSVLSPHAQTVIDWLGIDGQSLHHLQAQAWSHGSTLVEEIVAAKHATSQDIAKLIARVLAVPAENPALDVTVVKDARGAARGGTRHLVATTRELTVHAYVAPDLETLDEVVRALPTMPEERAMVRISTPEAIVAVREADSRTERSDAARLSLAADLNRWSARDVMTAYQGALLALLLAGIFAATTYWGRSVGVAVHVTLTLVAFLCTAFRTVVLLGSRPATVSALQSSVVAEPHGVPIYSVLVALHREAEMAASVVSAMAALEWPSSRLEVFFVCEATDPETVAAVEAAIVDHPNFSVVVTPATQPTTKPKALNFALPLTRGEYVVLYDAEDIPHPLQLKEAWATFRASDDSLACLQAPLEITNGASGWRQAHYAMEYAVLFRMLLPWLAARALPLPLGGTSNHFRRRHLITIGGWDSHNVAEDADLGIRLARLGFRTGTLTKPTLETSTTRWRDWRNQRTRWIKGWIQTWLVHMRDPALTRHQLGWRGMAAFQIVFLGMVASSIAHVALLAQLLLLMCTGSLSSLRPAHGWLYAVDAANLVLACLVFGQSFLKVARSDERPLATWLWSLWAYWALVSYAGVRAVWQLRRSPHLWEKTPHAVPNRPSLVEAEARPAPA